MQADRQGSPRGFGIAASSDLGVAREVAGAAEQLGYSSVWTNDTPAGDGISNAAAMLTATTRVKVGIGALPIDRRSVESIASELEKAALPAGRLVVVIGAGRARAPLAAVRGAVQSLKDRFDTALEVGVAALGPQMCRVAGRVGDLALLNWVSPERIVWSRTQIARGARGRDSESREQQGSRVAAYVRLAIGPGARGALAEEASRYGAMPHYASHFGAMGGPPAIAAEEGRDASLLLAPYERVLDETVVRAVALSPSPDGLLTIARAAAPD